MTKKKALIIVESPSKIKTLKKFLSDSYLFESSVGHIRDLPEKELGIDIKHHFQPSYVTLPGKEEVIHKLQKAAKQCDVVFLAPDPDREGEAIAWHITQILPENTPIQRISFNAITKDAVLEALASPRPIDMALVDAQQARRVLDRLVGYTISPLLNRRIQRGKSGSVSAGRVQSVALKLVVDREKAIAAFKPVEYWNLTAILQKTDDPKTFSAYLYSIDRKKVEKELVEGKEVALIGDAKTAEDLAEALKKSSYQIQSIEKKEKRRFPVPPFITSTLQQEASRHFGFSSSRTMSIAQDLYEGIDLGNQGPEGLITYMRTDSVRIAPEAIAQVRSFILQTFGEPYLPKEPKIYATQKSAQDAHEAIRPANLSLSPEEVESHLTKEQFLLYSLIWKRFVASQMMPAVYDTVSCDISAGERFILRATGSMMKFSGFLAVYEEKQDELEEEENKMLPPLEKGEKLKLNDLLREQAFTRPPPRFTEASLVKELEKSGIGRPSTYAAIMNKIQSREYTVKEQGRLKPTELGCVIADFLETNFPEIVNVGFTADMEDRLEDVAGEKEEWQHLVENFWKHFSPTMEKAEKEGFVPKVLTDLDCPKCGGKLQKIWFKSKYFYGCSNYPTCDFTAPVEELNFNKDDYDPDFDWEQKCPICGSEMKLRHGRFGPFLGCVNYPTCKGIVNITKKGQVPLPQVDAKCPALDCPGQLVARKSRFGKIFFSCSTYPDCDVIGNSVEEMAVKYKDHPRTPYVKSEKKTGRRGAASKKTVASNTKKKAAPKKVAAAKKTTAKSGTVKKSTSKTKKKAEE